MKLKVRGYDEHRLRDPYKFWSKVLDTPPRRKKRGVATYTYVSRLDDHTLRFTMGTPEKEADEQHLMCTLSDNDTWTILADPKKLLPGWSNRIQVLVGCYPAWNKKTFYNYENPCRLYYGNIANVPYEPGVQVYKATVLDIDKYVDRKRVLADKDGATEVKRKLEKIRELAPIMIRLLEAHEVKAPTWYEGKKIKEEMFKDFDLDNVTALDAERVFQVGRSTTRQRAKGHFNYTTGQWEYTKLESDDQYRRRCIVNGLRKLREHVYSQEGVYQYKELK